GEKFEQDFQELWAKEPLLPFYEVIEQSIDKKIITGKKAEQLQTFVKIFKKITFDDKPTVCINHIIFETNYYTYLKDNFDQKEAEIKIENIKELLRAAQFFEEQNATHNTLL